MSANTQYAYQLVFTKSNPWQRHTKCISTWIEQYPSFLARLKFESQHALTKTLTMTEDTKCISTCVEKNPEKPTMTQNVSQHVLKIQSHARTYRNFIATFVDKSLPCLPGHKNQAHPLSTRIENVSLLALTKKNPCQRDHKKYINMRWLNTPMPGSNRNAYQLVLTKPNQCQREYEKHINLCWIPNPY